MIGARLCPPAAFERLTGAPRGALYAAIEAIPDLHLDRWGELVEFVPKSDLARWFRSPRRIEDYVLSRFGEPADRIIELQRGFLVIFGDS